MIEYSIEKEIEILEKDLHNLTSSASGPQHVRAVKHHMITLLNLIKATNKRINEIYDASSFPEEIE